MRRYAFIVVLLGVTLLCGSFLAGKASAKPNKVIKLKMGTFWPIPHVMTSMMKKWIDDMEAKTEGRLEIDYYPAGQLVGVKDALEKIQSGIADIGYMNPTFWPAQFPCISVNTLPFAYSSAKHGTNMINALRDSGLFDRSFESNNLKLLWGFTPPPYQLVTSKKQVKKLEDFNGLRLRSAGGPCIMFIKSLGAVRVALASGDVYTSFQRGTIDGVFLPLSAASAFKLEEVARYVTKGNFYSCGLTLCANLNTWKKLPSDIQGHIMDASNAAAKRTGIEYDNREAKAFNAWEKAGIQIYTPPNDELTHWKETVAAVWEKWIAEKEEKGLPANKIVNKLQESVAD